VPPKDRLLPSLLDRLTDDDPTVSTPEADRFTFDLREYRAAVFRDLEWLLNTTSPARPEDVEELELMPESVLNYGMPPLSGGTAAGVEPRVLERAMREVILRYEPRLVPDTLKVKVEVEPGKMSHRALTFRVEGLLWAQPVSEQIYMRTQLDLETGKVTLAEVTTRERG
jgi:type VI secretion system protein ImpF